MTVTGGELSTPDPTTAFITGDAEVLPGSTVQLNSASMNADSLVWHQTAGSDVQVEGATSDSVQFTAPDTPQTLGFTLTATGPGGVHTSPEFTVDVADELPPPPLWQWPAPTRTTPTLTSR